MLEILDVTFLKTTFVQVAVGRFGGSRGMVYIGLSIFLTICVMCAC